MRIVIDMQGAQTQSRFRGIGRYTMSFAQAVVRNRGEHEVVLALNGLFSDTIEPIRAAFEGLLPQDHIRVWQAPGPIREQDPANDTRREVAELLREAFLASLRPDIIHVCSLFEGFIDDAVTSIQHFDHATPVSVILYDLIPLLNPDHYLKPDPGYERYYLRKVQHLRRASLYLAISDFARGEGIEALGVEDGSAVNISTAIDTHFRAEAIDNATATRLRQKLGISRSFVLYTGGSDERKNLPRLIEAFAMLPAHLRAGHQLLLAGKMPDSDVARFRQLARSVGLAAGELLFTGYLTDEELVQLYNLCTLYVFPSWHEGFGLPALEAMACGAPVIGANTASLPEVIGLQDALFDPFQVASIAVKLAQALEDEGFRSRLREHGLEQVKSFSWDETARRAIEAWTALPIKEVKPYAATSVGDRKPRLAFVSPLPPERTGIADYAAELLPALAEHYDLELVVAQVRVDEPWANRHGHVRDVTWLRANAKHIDRVLYQMGNSPFHRHMLPLMEEIPGVVVLHDFVISSLMSWLQMHGGVHSAWIKALYGSHGYRAVQAAYLDRGEAMREYPANWLVFEHALGVIAHSEYSRSMAQRWYGIEGGAATQVIPLLRSPAGSPDRDLARRQLGLFEDQFLVCSFGFLDSSKLNHRLLAAWLASDLAYEGRCHLVFVGENHGGDYGAALLRTIRESGSSDRIKVTGFASPELFKTYLAAADAAVQLRTDTRGETSAAVLDCMNYGLPVVVNAHGTLAELDREAVWMMPNEFEDADLVSALEHLWRSPALRRQLGERAHGIIADKHAPAKCARQYVEAIERFYADTRLSVRALVRAILDLRQFDPDDWDLRRLASVIDQNHPLPRPAKRLYLDVTATSRNDLRTGIERVARALMLALLESPPDGYRVEPVYLSEDDGAWCHRYARHYALELLGCPSEGFEEEIVATEFGDVLISLDLSGDMLVRAERSGLFREYRNRGVSVYATVFDLLPILTPEVFPTGADEGHQRWLESVSTFDGAICISKAVADELWVWQGKMGRERGGRRPFTISWFQLGSEIRKSAPSQGLPPDAAATLQHLEAGTTFLMVGTVEPRKGYAQVLDAFSQLWSQGKDVNLVIVGQEGWKQLPDGMRRDIPQTVTRLRTHPEVGKRLFWFEGISDEYLEKIYAASTCLIAASYGEGFGLPLIEGAQHKLPIIARDIPVFREVGGEYAQYFDAATADGLTQTISAWLALYESDRHVKSDGMPSLTWKVSASQLSKAILGTTPGK